MKKDLARLLLIATALSQTMGIVHAKTLMVDGKKIDYQLAPITLFVNERKIETTVMEPVQLENRVLVPTREVFEALGASVLWDNALKKATVSYRDQEVVLVINETTAFVNDEKIELDVPAKIVNDKVMLPIRFVSEALGLKIGWDAENRIVTINEPREVNLNLNKVLDITMDKENEVFSAKIVSSNPMEVEDVKFTVWDNKVIIDIANSQCRLNQMIEPTIQNTYVERIRTSQFNAETTRVVFDLKVPTKVETSFSDDFTQYEVKFVEGKEPIATNVPTNNESNENLPVNSVEVEETEERFYVAGKRPTFYLADIKANNIKVTDDYRNRTLIFDLGANYSDYLPDMMISPNDAYVLYINVKTEKTTKITLTTRQVYSYEIEKSNTSTVLKLIRPREKFKQIVVLDFGHGGSDSGAVGNGLTEKQINYNQGMALYKLLENDPNIKVYMTRESDIYPTLRFRSALANDIDADLFVSIHNNSISSSSTKGAETLYYPNAKDLRGKQMAQLVQNALVRLGQLDRGIKERPDLHVLNSTNMPAILLETGFISNATEAKLINSPTFISKWSQEVYKAIVTGFEKYLQR